MTTIELNEGLAVGGPEMPHVEPDELERPLFAARLAMAGINGGSETAPQATSQPGAETVIPKPTKHHHHTLEELTHQVLATIRRRAR